MITRQLFDRLHACCTTVYHLYEVEVAGGLNGDADADALANSQCGLRFCRNHLSLHSDAALRSLYVGGLLQELCIDSTPRGTFGSLRGSEGMLAVVWLGALHVAEASGRLAGVDGRTVDHKGGGRLAGGQRATVAIQEGIDGVGRDYS